MSGSFAGESVDPLSLAPDLLSMTESASSTIVAIVVLSVVAVILCGLSVYLAISNSKRFAAVDYESAEDEPSEAENMKETTVTSDAMSSISEDDDDDRGPLLRDAHSDGIPQVGSIGDAERVESEG